jgi:hypothetical protein
MYACSNCGLLVGTEDETEINEPAQLCAACRPFFRGGDDFDADELGIDPEEEFDA